MALRTGEKFLEGLRDGRKVWLKGERVENVTMHPKLMRMAHRVAGIYEVRRAVLQRRRCATADAAVCAVRLLAGEGFGAAVYAGAGGIRPHCSDRPRGQSFPR